MPTYLRIAEELRAAILSGELAAGAKLPTRQQLAERYSVSPPVIQEVIRALRSEGLVTSRPGSGVFVTERRPVRRWTRGHYGRRGQGSPFAAGERAAGREGTWEAHSSTERADAAIADRLGIEPADAVMRTAYTFRSDGVPTMLSTSWEPLAITGQADEHGRTPILFPEEGPYAGWGVVDRMDAIGMRVTLAREVTCTRPASETELRELGGISGGQVLHIVRTYVDAEGRPVETADIVLPGDRSEIESWYEIPQ